MINPVFSFTPKSPYLCKKSNDMDFYISSVETIPNLHCLTAFTPKTTRSRS